MSIFAEDSGIVEAMFWKVAIGGDIASVLEWWVE
jgi:hypothetical protein